MNLYFTIYLFVSYFIGCFCTAYYYGTLVKKVDLRTVGSKNLGATNSGRILGRSSFFIVLLGDFMKGLLVVLLGRFFDFNNIEILFAMFAVVMGHIFPIQLKGKGGKGIATFLGAITAYHYMYLLLLVITFIPSYLVLRKFTISGLIAILLLPILIFFFGESPRVEALGIAVCAVAILIKHKENICHTK